MRVEQLVQPPRELELGAASTGVSASSPRSAIKAARRQIGALFLLILDRAYGVDNPLRRTSFAGRQQALPLEVRQHVRLNCTVPLRC